MKQPSWWLEWPAGMIRVGVVCLVAVTVFAVVVEYPGLLLRFGNRASENSALSWSDREVAGGNELVADQAVVYAARGLIPEDETFRVVVDPEFSAGSALTPLHVGGYYRYFLLPRRYADDGPWIICYACDLAALGDVEVVWEGTDEISIARTRT